MAAYSSAIFPKLCIDDRLQPTESELMREFCVNGLCIVLHNDATRATDTPVTY